MPLGMMAGISYQEIEFQLHSGDVVVFMTDGIIEAKDSSGTEYQETDRLQQILAQFTADTSAERWLMPSSMMQLPLGLI